ncbi:MAG TPA: putative LPS assembly protein LptD [Longimicrobiales bacterium]|nr:putative LPS assembly protein LptD [Longimicrobiales bacterium]
MGGSLIRSGASAVGGAAGRAGWAACVLLLAPLLATAPAAAQQDTVRVDSAAADTLSPRERALRRLRALPTSPVQPDTAADSLAADSLAADSLAGPPGPPDLPRRQIVVGDPVRGPERPLREDSILALLRTLEGYEVTEYQAEGAVFEAGDDRLRLSGRSRVGRGRNALSSDSLLVYSGQTGVVCGYGNPVLEGEQEPVESWRVCYDIARDLGMAEGARTTFTQGATWYVRGAENRVYLLTAGENTELYGEKTEFTSCDLPEPHYTFRARSLKMRENDVMIARDVTLRFEDVPVFWLPWMVQSMKRDRRSGLLMPQFGTNDIVRNQSGYNRHISNLGFYWALNDYMSARATYEWFSGNWSAVTGAFSYRWLRQFLNGGVTLTNYWREAGRRDLTLNTSNSWQPDERTRLSLNGGYVSSTDFVKRNSFSPRELNRNITLGGGGTRSFDWGSINTSARRTQQLSTERVTTELPSVSLTLSPLTLFTSADGASSLTWNGSGDVRRTTVDVPDTLPGATNRDTEARAASMNQRLGFGRFSISQTASFSDDLLGFKPQRDTAGVLADSALPEARRERLRWGAQASYQQNLWTGTTLTPSVSVGGGSLRDSLTTGDFLDEPVRFAVGAGVNTSVYGFWPGIGPFSRIRHKISPSLSWSYSPAPTFTGRQDTVFGLQNLTEQNQISLSFNQTFEAKYADSDTAGAAADTAAGEGGEPRRLTQGRKITLLSLNTGTRFDYDFVAAEREGRGFMTGSDLVSNSIRSDLLRGFQLSTTHDIFREGDPAERPRISLPGTPPTPRTFDPFLTSVRASFSIDDDFWLFRVLGLSGGPAVADTAAEGFPDGQEEGPDGSLEGRVGADADPSRDAGGVGAIVNGRQPVGQRLRSGIGGWNASLSYSLVRSRPGEVRTRDNQMMTGNFSFRPTEHWSVRWSTGYSFTEGEFSDHMLTLSRDLHRWQANFDFIKAQNGNFAFSFRVNLLDNPDLKLDYDQRTDPSQSGLREDGR